jgi:hypothetical protein
MSAAVPWAVWNTNLLSPKTAFTLLLVAFQETAEVVGRLPPSPPTQTPVSMGSPKVVFKVNLGRPRKAL